VRQVGDIRGKETEGKITGCLLEIDLEDRGDGREKEWGGGGRGERT